MANESRYDALEQSARDEEERLELLKWEHRRIQQMKLENARNLEVGKASEKEVKELADDCDSKRADIEQRILKTERGRSYLQGKEAQEVREELHREDSEQRQKDRYAERLVKLDKQVDRIPRAAEVSKEAVEPEEGKRKAREAMSFLLKPSKSKDLRPKERDKDKDKDRGWEPE